MVKLLVAGLPNTGKTSLLKDLDPETSLVISRDGKKFPLPIPKRTIEEFTDANDLINQIGEAILAFKEAKGVPPKTVAIDSISKILLDIEARVLARVSSFPYGEVNKEIGKLTDFLEQSVAANCNLVMVSHALANPDSGQFDLVNAGGSWGKKGGMLSEVNNSIFLQVKGKKRVIHHRNTHLARTLLDSLPDSHSVEEYDLQKHIDALNKQMTEADSFEL